jgi:hypothetical protein
MPVDGTEQFKAAAHALNEAADKGIRREVYAAFRRVAKPLGEQIVEKGSQRLPRRGGLAARVAAAKVGQSNATTGKNPSVAIRVRAREGYDLKSVDAGTLRHPVFARAGRPRVWSATKVNPNAFTAPFEGGVDQVRTEVLAALERVAEQIRSGSAGGSFGGKIG